MKDGFQEVIHSLRHYVKKAVYVGQYRHCLSLRERYSAVNERPPILALGSTGMVHQGLKFLGRVVGGICGGKKVKALG